MGEPERPQYGDHRGGPPHRVWRWLAPVLVVVAAAAVVVPVVLLGGKDEEPGRPVAVDASARPSSQPSSPSPSSGVPSYQPFPDGSGYSTGPMDQPFPFPSQFWPGLRDFCEWITPELARRAGGTGEANAQPAGCSVLMGGNEVVQVTSIGAYGWVTDPYRFMRPVTVAGLQAREYAFTGQSPTECSLEVNTRSPVALDLVAWDPKNRNSGNAKARCQVVRRVAEVLVREYVPAAGGTPWSRTPQRPASDVGAGKVACELVDESVAVYGNTDPRLAATGTDPLGTTCTYEGQSNKFVALITDRPGTGLTDVEPRVPDATVTDRKLGELPARQEDAGTTCALSVEFTPGRVFTITYQHDRVLGLACKDAEVVAAVLLTDLINASTG